MVTIDLRVEKRENLWGDPVLEKKKARERTMEKWQSQWESN